jgi:outer membrane protein assembly factor BamB
MILTMSAKGFIGVNADTGKLLFHHPFETKYDINALKPIFHDGQVFISGGYGTTGSELLALTVQGDSASVQKVWGSRELDNHHGGVLLIDGFLYGAAHSFNRGKWICLDWKTGEMKWAEYGVGGRNERNRKGAGTYADEMLYQMSEDMYVGLARISPAGLEIVSQFQLPPGSKDKSWAHPVVCGGRLYIRHDFRLFAYNVKAGS